MNPSKKLQVYIYTLIIAVLRLQLTVDRNEECYNWALGQGRL